MRSRHLLLLTLFSMSATVAAANGSGMSDRAETSSPKFGDMCAFPAGWAPPFTHAYRFRNGATVVFVGVEHTRDPNDAVHRQIKAAFDRYKPDFVLVEGASATKSSSDRYLAFLTDTARRQAEAGAVGENLYAVELASDSGTPFAGWDFSPDQDYRVLVDDKFDIRDALGAHLLRSHIDPFGSGGGQEEVARQLRYVAAVRPIAAFDYAAWYRQAYGDRFDPANGTPCGTGIASRAVGDLSYRRNLNLTGLIDGRAQPGKTLLVEAGAGHWLALRDWLRSRSTKVD